MSIRPIDSATPRPVLTPELLITALGIHQNDAGIWCGPLQRAASRFEISTPLRLSAWLAQLAYESTRFTRLVENLNYSAERLRLIFPRYFPNDVIAGQYAGNPERIANRVYANRIGNGDEASGDGWKYRGRGLIQLTGRANYADCGKALRLPLVDEPSMLLSPSLAAMSAGWFWHSRALNAAADQGAFLSITKTINGGTHGADAREMIYQRVRSALA